MLEKFTTKDYSRHGKKDFSSRNVLTIYLVETLFIYQFGLFELQDNRRTQVRCLAANHFARNDRRVHSLLDHHEAVNAELFPALLSLEELVFLVVNEVDGICTVGLNGLKEKRKTRF